MHVDKRRRVAKVDDNGGPKRELPIASQASDCSLPDTYLSLSSVKLEQASRSGAAAFQIRVG
jgi:hypothetical protein